MAEPLYRLYGVTLSSSFPFRYHFERSSGPADLRFVYHGAASERDPPGSEVYSGNGMRLFVSGGSETVVFPGTGTEPRTPQYLIFMP